ncbi:hypothetical protein ACE1OC_40495 [Streptomyces sp. DSM 116496]|uniref:hypothetical protein n=1 Tax=Streptomyces stoeckheimensis TaxID=3344656 RepID=UPI0038B2638C
MRGHLHDLWGAARGLPGQQRARHRGRRRAPGPARAASDAGHGARRGRLAGLASYDRIFASYAVPAVPAPWIEQLAPQGLALAHIASGSPSRPALAVISKTAADAGTGELRPTRNGHRAGHGLPRLYLSKPFRERIDVGQGAVVTRGRQEVPALTERAFWLANDACTPARSASPSTANHLRRTPNSERQAQRRRQV